MNNLKDWLSDTAHIRQTIIIALICAIAVGSAAFIQWIQR